MGVIFIEVTNRCRSTYCPNHWVHFTLRHGHSTNKLSRQAPLANLNIALFERTCKRIAGILRPLTVVEGDSNFHTVRVLSRHLII